MANATLSDIDAALLAALNALTAEPVTASHRFGFVARYAGPVPPEGLNAPKYPCALLRFGGEVSRRDINTWGNTTEETGTVAWDVLVAVEDPQGIDSGIYGNTTNAPGLLRCVDAVLSACNSLLVANTYQGIPVRYVGTRPELIVRSAVYVYAVSFEAMRVVPQATNTDPAADLPYVQPMIGGIDLIDGQGDTDDVNPLVTFQADPNP